MKTRLFIATLLATLAPATAFAQDGSVDNAAAEATAPDGTSAYGIEPYVGVLGGYHSFDRDSEFGASQTRGRVNGALISGVAGVNFPRGAAFVGVEGNATKGFGDIEWEYGVKGRVGARAGDSGLIYVSAGHQWINGKRGFSDQNDWIYGLGAEIGPKDIGLGGITSNSGVRLRLQVDTYDFDSLRPMAGVIVHF